MTHEAISAALCNDAPLTGEQRALLVGLVADDKVWQREADRLRAESDRLRETLRGIRDANWREWDNASADEFVAWAQSRARHVLQDLPNAIVSGAPADAEE